jgi:hypothetical protein
MNTNGFKRPRVQCIDHRPRPMRGCFAFRVASGRFESIGHETGRQFPIEMSRLSGFETEAPTSMANFGDTGARQITIAGSAG